MRMRKSVSAAVIAGLLFTGGCAAQNANTKSEGGTSAVQLKDAKVSPEDAKTEVAGFFTTLFSMGKGIMDTVGTADDKTVALTKTVADLSPDGKGLQSAQGMNITEYFGTFSEENQKKLLAEMEKMDQAGKFFTTEGMSEAEQISLHYLNVGISIIVSQLEGSAVEVDGNSITVDDNGVASVPYAAITIKGGEDATKGATKEVNAGDFLALDDLKIVSTSDGAKISGKDFVESVMKSAQEAQQQEEAKNQQQPDNDQPESETSKEPESSGETTADSNDTKK